MTNKPNPLAALLAKSKARKKQVEEATSTTPTPTPKLESTSKPVVDIEAIKAKLNLSKPAPNLSKGAAPASNLSDQKAATYKLPAQNSTALGMSGELITYNAEQQEFIDLVSRGESCVLIGAAGTGKTACSQGAIKALVASGKIPVLKAENHKHLASGSSGVIIISYTRRAVNNIRKIQSEDLKSNCITSHKLLEYQPEYYELEDPETGKIKRTMQFVPSRCASNPLPNTIHTIIVEEASMLSLELYEEIEAALNRKVQWVFIGDIQQLPPVFGAAILGYKLLSLPVVELKQVYRQALESPIIRLAHKILSGTPIPADTFSDWHTEGQLTIHPWKKKLHPDAALATLAAFFKAGIDKGIYIPEEDMILIPYNKSCGTIELNKHIANHIARKNSQTTYEVMAGFNKHYFSVGDKVLYDREDAEIIEIVPNPAYSGKRVQPPSMHLDYWGHNPKREEEEAATITIDQGYDVDSILGVMADPEERTTQASHKVLVRLLDTASEIEITKAAEVNNLLLSYALTVHKSQGSEWRKVFFTLHQSHATMLQRELLYTGVTRAREELYIICEPESLTKGVISQKIKGDTLEEKAEYFKGKLDKLAR